MDRAFPRLGAKSFLEGEIFQIPIIVSAMGDKTAFGPFVLDRQRRQLTLDGNDVPVGHRGYTLLETLLDAGGEPVSKEALMDRVWPGTVIEEGSLTVQVSALRRQLGDGAQAMIITVPRVGYRLVAPRQEPRVGRDGLPLIAVLPFVNHGSDLMDGYFADGVVDDIITALSRFKNFAVISRGASFAIGKHGDLRLAASGLGIRYGLEGGVRRTGDRLRVTARLIEAASGTQLWGDRFDGVASDVFEFQDRIVEAVVGVMEPEIRKAEIERARRKPAASLDAYDHFLRALQHIQSPSIEKHHEALHFLRKASELDPDFALPMAHAAWIYEKRLSLRAPSIAENDVEEGTALARRALVLGGADPLVRAICGYVLYRLAGEHAGIQALRQAVTDSPNSAAIHALAAAGIGLQKNSQEEAYRLWQRAYELSPGAPEAYQFLFGMAAYQLRQGNFEAAIECSRRSLATFNDWLFSYITLVAAYVGLNRMEEAQAALRKVREISPHLTIKLIDSGRAPEDSFADAVVPALRQAGLPEQ